MLSKKILIVDDEEHILELLKYNLTKDGYLTVEADSGETALEILKTDEDISAIILDWMLPGIDGIDVLKRIRTDSKLKRKPVIMLTAKNEEFDTILGLEMGADDYISKPFSTREVLTRLKVLLRRTYEFDNVKEENLEIINFKDISINEVSRTVSLRGKLLELPLKEYELLLLFVKNLGKVFTREELLDKVWGYDFFGETRTVDVHIRNLRKKIEKDDANPEYIRTVRGVGYKLGEV